MTALARYDLLVLGELNADLILHGGDVVPRFGQREQLVEAGDLVLGGAGAITAVGAARLGLRVAYLGLAGEDLLGGFVLERLGAAGVDTAPVLRRADVATGLSVVLARPDGDRAILTVQGAMAALSADAVAPAVLAGARHLHASSPFLQSGLLPGLGPLLRGAREAGVGVSLDPGWDPKGRWRAELEEALAAAEVVFPNAQELAQLTGEADPEAGAAQLAALGPTVVVKLGDRGALAHDGQRSVYLAGAPVEPGDTTGAGDSFAAGFLAGRLEGRGVRECLALGNACGALSLRAAGGTAGQADRAEAEALAVRLLEAPTATATAPTPASALAPLGADMEAELSSQPAVWRRILALGPAPFETLPARGARVLAIGAGSSHHVLAAYAARRRALHGDLTHAVVASELEAIDGCEQRYDVALVLSRSGTTSDAVRALERLDGRLPIAALLGDPHTPVGEAADAVVAMEFADERSVVQTRFATGALVLLLASLGEDLLPAVADAERALAEPLAVAPEPFDHVVFLGTGWTAPLAQEAALKCREAACLHTEAYPVGEYQHGPIAVAGPTSLVWSLAPLPGPLRAAIEATGATVREARFEPLAELVAVHRVALAAARARGLDPDAPAHLSRSVILEG